MHNPFHFSGPASRIDSPTSSPKPLSDVAFKNILTKFGRSLMQDVRSQVEQLTSTVSGRLDGIDSKMRCKCQCCDFLNIVNVSLEIFIFSKVHSIWKV